MAASLTVRLSPRASRDEIVGWRGDELRVRLRAPPVDGRANEALVKLLASRLDMAPSAIELVSGATGRVKRLRVEGISERELRRLLG